MTRILLDLSISQTSSTLFVSLTKRLPRMPRLNQMQAQRSTKWLASISCHAKFPEFTEQNKLAFIIDFVILAKWFHTESRLEQTEQKWRDPMEEFSEIQDGHIATPLQTKCHIHGVEKLGNFFVQDTHFFNHHPHLPHSFHSFWLSVSPG